MFVWSDDVTVIGEVKGTSGTHVGAVCQVLAEMQSVRKDEGRWPTIFSKMQHYIPRARNLR